MTQSKILLPAVRLTPRGIAILAGGLALAPVGGASAQSVDSLVALAMRTNPEIRSMDARTGAARERIAPAGALPDPVLTYRLDRIPSDSADPGRAAAQRFGVMQMFPFPGKQGRMRGMAAEEAEMARAARDRARLEVAADLRGAYAQLAAIESSIRILEEDSRSLEALAEAALVRYQVGETQQAELLRMQVELAESRMRSAVLRDQIPAWRARINELLGRAPDASIRTTRPDTTFHSPSLDSLDRRVERDQPNVLFSKRAERRSSQALGLARKEGWPDLGVGFEYMAERGMPDSWMGMIEVRLPIWRWNKVAPTRRAAEQDLDAAKEETRRSTNEAVATARSLLSEALAARREMTLYRTQVIPRALTSLESTRSAYETGKAAFLDFLDARRSLLRARLAHEEAVAEFLDRSARLRLAMGDRALEGADVDG